MWKPRPTNTCMCCCDLFMHLTFGGEAGCLWTRRIGAEVCPPRRTPSWETRSHSLFGWWGCAYSVVPPGLRWEREGRAKARDRSAMEKVKSKLFHYIDTISTQRGQMYKMHSCGFENKGKRKKIPLKRTYVLQALTQAYTANSTSEAGICLCFSALLHLSSVFMSLHIDAVQASSIFSIMCGCGYRAAWDLLSVGIFKPLASQRQFRCDPCVLPLPRVEFFSIISGAA